MIILVEKMDYTITMKIFHLIIFMKWENIITDGLYRLKLFINFNNKVNKQMKKQLDNGYFALNNATDNGYFKIGLVRAFK